MATFGNSANSRSIEPLSSLESQLRVEVTVDTVNGRQAALDAKISGSIFRDIEKILACRSPEEVPDITQRIEEFKTLLSQVTAFIRTAYLPDVNNLTNAYKDYFAIGAGHKNHLAYGAFDLDETGKIKLLRRGRQSAGIAHLETVEAAVLTEHVTNSWYSLEINDRNGSFRAPGFKPARREPRAWLKAPRYQQKPYEVGSLARMKINGDYAGGFRSWTDFLPGPSKPRK
jgi:Ni,Fe-hydrogenase I large subunit